MAELNLTANVNGINLSYNRYGKGNSRKMILVHGWTGSKGLWDSFAPRLAENDIDAITYDLRGGGDSDKPKGEYTHEVFSKDIYELSKFLGWDKFILLGQSMGGYIVLDYALRYPETLEKVISSNTSVYLGRNLMSKLTWKMIVRMYRKDPPKMMKKMTPSFFQFPVEQELIDQFIEMSLKTDVDAGLKAIHECITRNFEPELHKIQVPTLVISSEFDMKSLRNATLEVHNQLPNSQLVDIKHTGHLPFMENPDDFLQAIVDFIK
jgi:pimeloyl-ACP methyl ester carboxylesterase